MKKYLALLMAVFITFSLAACKNNQKQLSNDSTPAIVENDYFKTPNNYAVVLQVSINPQIKLYIGNDNIVMALQAVNQDSKQIVDELTFKDSDYQTVIKLFITLANSNGFIKEDAKINFEIVEAKDTSIDTNVILSNASIAATKAANELNIVISTNVENNNSMDDQEQPSSSTNKTESKPTQSESTKTKPENTHTHEFSSATCTEAAKCSCGATDGKALGHNWQAATCKSAKTCNICGATEGDKGDHTYSNGKCTVCAKVNSDMAREILYNWFSLNCVDANYSKCYFLPSDNNYYLTVLKTGDIFFYYSSDNETIILSVYGFEDNKCYLTYIYDNMTIEGEFPLDSLHSTDRNFFNIMNSIENDDIKTQLIENLRNKIDLFLLKFENEILKPNVNITLNDLGFSCY